MRKLLCITLVVFVVGLSAFTVSVVSQPADAQDQTDERLIALETQVAKLSKDMSSVRKRVRALEDEDKAPTEEPSTKEPTATETASAEQAEPASTPSGTLGGNGLELLPPGEKGKLDVVLVGSYDGNVLPIIVRNNTDGDVIRVAVSAVARSSEGQLLSSGGDQGFRPNVVAAGSYTVGYIYFDGIDLPSDATFEFEVSATDADDDQFETIRDLDVNEAEFLGDRIVGILQNNLDETVKGPMGVIAACLGSDGVLLGVQQSYTDKEEASTGETVPFQIDLYGDIDCSTFVIAASGYNF